MANGPNPVRLVADHLPEHIADLETELNKTVLRVRELQVELSVARTLLAITPAANGEDGNRG
jgi:hypothetical protein